MPEVICINATDGYGKVSNFNPPFRKGNYNFCTLGEAVLDSWQSAPPQRPPKRETGTSFATPLAAAIAACFIEFLWQSKHGAFKITNDLKSEVRTRDGMLKIFAAISEKVQGFDYLKPWRLLECKYEREVECEDKCRGAREIAGRRISDILQNALPLPSDLDTLANPPVLTHVVAADVRTRTHEGKPRCLAGTRVGLRDQIQAWANSSSKQYICWISGRLGTGKSTIARTIALQYSEQGCLAGTFFFSKNEKALKTRDNFVSTLAHQLTKLSPTLKLAILKQKIDEPGVEELAMGMQWEKLIHIPLSQLKSRNDPIFIVLDALDECEDLNEVVMDIINLSVRTAALENVRLRFLITSRPESHIQTAFAEFPQVVQHIKLDELDKSTIDRDISELLQVELRNLNKGNRGIEEGWPGDKSIKKLTERANGLFIYAAMTCRYIKEPGAASVKKRLTQVLEEHAFDTLDNMYNHILVQAVAGLEEQLIREQFRAILGVIVALFEPMPEKVLCALCPEKLREELELDVVCRRLDSLRSVLVVPESDKDAVYISHQSFREFLLRRRQEGRFIWLNDEMHRDLFISCLRLLTSDQDGLRRDICSLKHPGVEISRRGRKGINGSLLPQTRYACRRWIDHLEKLGPSQRREAGLCDGGRVHNFLLEHLLHWIEALSLLEEISGGIHAIQSLGSMIEAKESPQLYAFVEDARRFILYNRTIIEKAPLQIYCSALVFAPQQSSVRRQFAKEMPNWITRRPAVQPKWTSLLQTLGSAAEYHSLDLWDTVRVKFSEDGKLVISLQFSVQDTSEIMVFRVWNATTGALLNTMKFPGTAAFDTKGKLVASLNLMNGVELFGAVNGRIIRTLQTQPHEDFKIDMTVFSLDGKRVAAGTNQGFVHLWDVETGHLLRTFVARKTLWQEYAVFSIACSPDNKWVGGGFSQKCEFCVWSADDGSVVYETTDAVSIDFSPDSKLVVFISNPVQILIRVLDVSTGLVLYTIDHCAEIVFSLDGKLACSREVNRGSCKISLRDATTGEPTGVALCPRHPVIEDRRFKDMAFTPNGKLLSIYGYEPYLLLIDITTGQQTEACKEGSHFFSVAAFSPDSTVVALGSEDGLVRLWDTRTWTARISTDAVDDGHGTPVNALALSPDGKLVASGVVSGPVKIWDVAKGVLLRRSKSSYNVQYNLISWEGAKRVVVCDYNTLVFLDAESLGELHRIDLRIIEPLTMAFSPDGGMVAASSSDNNKKILFYDLLLYHGAGKSGKLGYLHDTDIYGYEAVAFSPDNNLVAVGGSREVLIWDAETRDSMST